MSKVRNYTPNFVMRPRYVPHLHDLSESKSLTRLLYVSSKKYSRSESPHHNLPDSKTLARSLPVSRLKL